jgi:hypothetical protein
MVLINVRCMLCRRKNWIRWKPMNCRIRNKHRHRADASRHQKKLQLDKIHKVHVYSERIYR